MRNKLPIKPSMQHLGRRALLAGLFPLLLLAGCASNDVDPDTLPVELADFTAALQVEELWSRNIGTTDAEHTAQIRPAVSDGVVYVANSNGRVMALDLATGDQIWRIDTDRDLAAATGVGDGLVLVSSTDGEVIALDATDGSERWRHALSSEVLAAPSAGFGVTVALALDGRVYALDSVSGEQLWRADAVKPLLTLRGNASPEIVEGVALIGHDSGKVAAYRLSDGANLWTARVGAPEGANELERMVDVDARPRYLNGLVYGLSYQGGLMAISPQTGRGNWFQPTSSIKEIGLFGGTVAITDDQSRLFAYNAISGSPLWDSLVVRNRQATGPVVADNWVAVADFQGYVHFLRRTNGSVIQRVRVGRNPVSSPLVPISDGVLVLDDSGRLTALGVRANN